MRLLLRQLAALGMAATLVAASAAPADPAPAEPAPRSGAAAAGGSLASADPAGERAAAAFDQGDFAAAAAAYEGLVESGVVNGHLYYNLGVAEYRLGRPGQAMAAFLAARRYLPRDPDVAANLRFIVAAVHDRLEPELPRGLLGRLGVRLDELAAKELALATALLAALSGSLITLAWLRRRPVSWRRLALATLALPLAAGAGLAVKTSDKRRWGAVTAKTAPVYSGPGAKNPVVFELQDGAPVLVGGEVAGGYRKVELSDGNRGWIPDTDVRVY